MTAILFHFTFSKLRVECIWASWYFGCSNPLKDMHDPIRGTNNAVLSTGSLGSSGGLAPRHYVVVRTRYRD